AGQEFRPPPGWDAGFEHGEAFSETDAAAASDFFEALFGRARGPRRGPGAGFGTGGFRAEGIKIRGGDHQAKVLIDLEDAYRGPPVTALEACFGRKVIAPTPEGTVNLQIAGGSAAGGKLRLKGRGIPGEPPGDLYVVLQIALPAAGTEAARRIYREMEERLD